MDTLAFIVVDDRELDCFIAEKLIDKIDNSLSVKSFYEAHSCLKHIDNIESHSNTIILLDIMMPVMTGFDFLDAFEQLDEEKKQWYRIVPITTSLNKNEIQRIGTYPSVLKVLQKPYSVEEIKEIIELADF
ncbi:response regulator receiver [Pseudopedobacter saltans DSM 12145]|uniref:Response regulator receiver n=1 Tax=Pseudopedobacter saltans (strain ATCC 51119 / DSM 12145 / JCM 21818 / CCUG 39354 / LMG 10337 / NBRC 100064 / NCIMB 13643) TaxID=762903 RepID=F0SCN8_PSESL|nr:response regulator [Pseudopedobacter saltans]ADY53882.1 response regulator receiver [Pseudopedobacter saltans DSM 12145]